MNKVLLHTLSAIISISILGLLQGCANSQPVPSDSFYRLAIQPVKQSEYNSIPISGILSISRFSTDALHSERPMLYTEDDSGLILNQYHYHHWIDSPANMIQEQMVRYFQDSGALQNVYTSGTTNSYDYLLKGKLFRFERVVGSSSRVDIELEINFLKKSAQENILSRRYKKEIPVNGDSMHDVVTHFNNGLSEIFSLMLNDIGSYCRISQKCN